MTAGHEALLAATEFEPDLVVLDVMLPDLDGFEVIERLRAAGQLVPVLFLTARDAVQDRISGLAGGGDDYVTKPFSLEELVLRIRAILRRSRGARPDAGPTALRYADLELDEQAHEVRRAGKVIDLSPTEFNLLRYLLANAGRVVSKAQILEQVWRYDFGGDARIVERRTRLALGDIRTKLVEVEVVRAVRRLGRQDARRGPGGRTARAGRGGPFGCGLVRGAARRSHDQTAESYPTESGENGTATRVSGVSGALADRIVVHVRSSRPLSCLLAATVGGLARCQLRAASMSSPNFTVRWNTTAAAARTPRRIPARLSRGG